MVKKVFKTGDTVKRTVSHMFDGMWLGDTAVVAKVTDYGLYLVGYSKEHNKTSYEVVEPAVSFKAGDTVKVTSTDYQYSASDSRVLGKVGVLVTDDVYKVPAHDRGSVAVHFPDVTGYGPKEHPDGGNIVICSPEQLELVTVVLTPHVHCDVIKAYADGAIIQTKWTSSGWADNDSPTFAPTMEYRVKPAEPVKTAAEIEKESIVADMQALQERLDKLDVSS